MKTAAETAPSPSAAQRDATPRWRQLGTHAAVLWLLLVALTPLFDATTPAFPDEGLYSAQVHNLANGSWSAPRPAPDLDTTGVLQPLAGALVEGDESIPYARRPAYPLLLTPAYWAFGGPGLIAMSILGTWLAALTAGLLAGRADRRYAVPTLWLVGAGSPLLFDAYLVIGHSLAAGLAGVVLWGVSRLVDDARYRWLAPTLGAAALLVLIRSEGTILVAAVVAAVGLASIDVRRRSIDRRRAAVAVALGATGAAAFVLDGVLARELSRGLQSGSGSVVSSTDPLRAAWTDLLRPWYSEVIAAPGPVLAVITSVLAVLLLRFLPRRPLLPVAMLVVGAVAAVSFWFSTASLITGLLPAFPVLAAVVLLRTDDLRRSPLGRCAGVAALGTVGLLATVYGAGEGAQWGGRFFHVLLPALGPLVVVGLDRARRQLSSTEARLAGAAVVVLTLALSVGSLRANLDSRGVSEDLLQIEAVLSQSSAQDPLAVVSLTPADGSTRRLWEPVSREVDLLFNPDFIQLFEVVRLVEATGRPDLLVVTNVSQGGLGIALAPVLEELDWALLETTELGDSGFRAVLIGDA